MISKKMSDMAKNGSAIRAMFEEGKKMAALYGKENVYDFSLGNPNTPPPECVREAAIEILKEENPIFLHGYMSNTGYEDVRDIIAASLNEKHGTQYDRNNLIMTVGAAGSLNVALKTILKWCCWLPSLVNIRITSAILMAYLLWWNLTIPLSPLTLKIWKRS